MGNLLRSHAWENTDVGPLLSWPRNLLNAVSLMLSSRFSVHTTPHYPSIRTSYILDLHEFIISFRFPMLLYWGPRFEIIYNDASIPVSFEGKERRRG